VDGSGRLGPLGTVFYDTLLDENAASHIAFGAGYPAGADPADAARINQSAIHIDFMIGDPAVTVLGVDAEGRESPVLEVGAWRGAAAPA
jgi:aminopeptidase